MDGRPLSAIARILGGRAIGQGDPVITGLAVLEDTGPGDLTFVAKKSYLGRLEGCRASGVILGPDMVADIPGIRVDDPYRAFATLLQAMLPDADRLFPPGIHPTAVIAGDADVEQAASIGPYCVVGPNVVIGKGSRLGPQVLLGADVKVGSACVLQGQVTVQNGCILGDRVILHPGVVVGSDGFGYLPGSGGMTKIPQVGIVVIEDDVEVGACSCIDRATIGKTVVGQGSKIDNQVQVGHNVQVGRYCALSAQTGIAGSAILEDGVVAGGQVGIGDHLRVGAGSKLGGKAGVWRHVPAGSTVFGYPALDYRESFRITHAMRHLPALLKRVKQLEEMMNTGNDEE